MEKKRLSFFHGRITVFDGAMGSAVKLLEENTSGLYGKPEYHGCIEALNLFSPDTVEGVHAGFISAGAQVLETNTFGANGIVLAEYGLEHRIAEINRAAVAIARKAIRASGQHILIAGSIGPSTKMPSLGHIGFDDMAAAYLPQIRCFIEDRVDIITIETCQDILQAKTVLITINDTLKELAVPAAEQPLVMVSLTLEATGVMLAGSDLQAALAVLSPFAPDIVGLNCATGPAGMEGYLAMLRDQCACLVSLMPNAGMPLSRRGRTIYPESPEEFANTLAGFVVKYGIDIVGGCCGTTPDHIRAVAKKINGVAAPARRARSFPATVSSLYGAVTMTQDPAPFIIGERANATGSKKFRDLLLAEKFEEAVAVANDQEKSGAHAVDISLAFAGRNEIADSEIFFSLAGTRIRLPVVIDSTNPAVLEVALKKLPGRSLINSVNLEDGGGKLRSICGLAARFKTPIVALAIDEKGMAVNCDHKLEVFRRIRKICSEEFGLSDGHVLYDFLTFTVGSGDSAYFNSAIDTLHAIQAAKREFPGVLTTLGVSNVSFGLSKEIRPFLNTVFLNLAIEHGLDAAIIDSAKIIPSHAIPDKIRVLCTDLLLNHRTPGYDPLKELMANFSGPQETAAAQNATAGERPPLEQIRLQVINGEKRNLTAVLDNCMTVKKPVEIISGDLIPAMKEVGDLFGSGKMQLPFVLQSAEVMKEAVRYLEKFMDKTEVAARKKLLIGTVAGDVHDIGKNLVAIIVSNNGYEVVDLGIKTPVARFIEAIHEHKPYAVGMSGLLVQSTNRMRENLEVFASNNITLPVLLGGAALTPSFVRDECQPIYKGMVTYCRDAFEGLHAMNNGKPEQEVGRLSRPGRPVLKPTGNTQENKRPIGPAPAVPKVPFVGIRQIRDIQFSNVERFLNKEVLFRGRWGFRRGSLSTAEFQEQRLHVVEPAYISTKTILIERKAFTPAIAYGYFPCYSKGNTLNVIDAKGDVLAAFNFPRQAGNGRLCIADFFRPQVSSPDVVGVLAVTLGNRLGHILQELYAQEKFRDYFLLHGLGVEVTDALAEEAHRIMREEMGIAQPIARETADIANQPYQGSRFAFGYPACPDLSDNGKLLALVQGESIGISLTEGFQMGPEFSTTALVVHHPQARYFMV